MMKKSNKKGFTLVELIVVIAIMAILAAVLVPTITNKIKDANSSAAKSDVASLASGIQADLMSIHAGTFSGLTYFDDITHAAAAATDTEISAKLKAAPEGVTYNKDTSGKIIISKKGGNDTWQVEVTIATGAVSAPTKVAG